MGLNNKMSITLPLQNGSIPAFVSVDPVIRFDGDSYKYEINKSSTAESVVNYQAQGMSTDAVVFSIESMGPNLIMNRRIITHWDCVFTLTGTAPAGSALLFPNGINDIKGNLALRWLPFISNSSTLQVSIAGVSSSYSPNLYLEALDRYSGNLFFRNELGSIGPSMHDTAQDYNDSYQTNKDPLAGYFNSEFDTRGAFEFELLDQTNTQARVQIKWNEPVIHPLLVSGDGDDAGFYGLNTATQIRYTSSGIAERLLSMRSDPVNLPTITQVSMQFADYPYATVRWLTPPVNYNNSDSLITRWPFINFIDWVTPGISVPAGASATMSSSILTAQCVPSKMLICLKETLANIDINSTNTYARIDGVSIKFANVNGILSGSGSVDLYARACSNGLKDVSWSAWNKYVGSPLLLDFAKDIPMAANIAVDTAGQYTFQITVNFTNLSNRAITFDLATIPFQNGIFTIKGTQGFLDTSFVQPGSFSVEDVLASIEGKADLADKDNIVNGGSFLDKAKKIFKSKEFKSAMKGADAGINLGLDIADTVGTIVPTVDKVTGIIRKFYPKAKDAASLLGTMLLGSGFDQEDLYNILLDAGYPDIEIRAAGISGGCSGAGLRGGSLYHKPHYIRKHLR